MRDCRTGTLMPVAGLTNLRNPEIYGGTFRNSLGGWCRGLLRRWILKWRDIAGDIYKLCNAQAYFLAGLIFPFKTPNIVSKHSSGYLERKNQSDQKLSTTGSICPN